MYLPQPAEPLNLFEPEVSDPSHLWSSTLPVFQVPSRQKVKPSPQQSDLSTSRLLCPPLLSPAEISSELFAAPVQDEPDEPGETAI